MNKPDMDRPCLLFVGELYQCYADLLSVEFDVQAVAARSLSAAAIRDVSYCIVCDDALELDKSVLDALIDMVSARDGVLILYGEGLHYRDDAFYRFCGMRQTAVSGKRGIHLRVYPHILTRGEPEEVDLSARLIEYELSAPLTERDECFLRDENAGCLGYEKVFGMKGRVINIMLAYGSDPSPVELAIFRNFAYFLHTSERVDDLFGDEFTDMIPFDKSAMRESHEIAGRWNSLVSGSGSVYTHSSVFLPASPDFIARRISGWGKGAEEITRQKLMDSLSVVEIRNTDYCSQDCYYCYNRRSMDIGHVRTQLDTAVHVVLEDELIALARAHPFSVRYTGVGEPLMHPRTAASLIRFEKAGLPTILVTNCYGIDAETAVELGEHATYVRISIDAADAETYAKIRRCDKGAFHQVLENIRALRRGGGLIGATFLVCRENFAQIADFCCLAKSLGIQLVWIRSTDNNDPFTDAEMDMINAQLKDSEALADGSFYVFTAQFSIYRTVSALHYRYYNERCWSAYTKAFIEPNGDVAVCLSRPDFVLGNIYAKRFSDIWGSERHIAFLKNRGFEECSQCIESRYNRAADFMAKNAGSPLFKATRRLML